MYATIRMCIPIVAIGIVLVYALSEGVDGAILVGGLVLMAGIAGYEVKKQVESKG